MSDDDRQPVRPSIDGVSVESYDKATDTVTLSVPDMLPFAEVIQRIEREEGQGE